MLCGYQYIWADKLAGGTLYHHLRHSGKRRKQCGLKDKRGQICPERSRRFRDRVIIDDRPVIVSEKRWLGAWEIDNVIGKNQQATLVTIVVRISKFTLIKKVASKYAEVVTEATLTLLRPYFDKTLTITADNSKNFVGHEKIKVALEADAYFAHPFSSRECGFERLHQLLDQAVLLPKADVLSA